MNSLVVAVSRIFDNFIFINWFKCRHMIPVIQEIAVVNTSEQISRTIKRKKASRSRVFKTIAHLITTMRQLIHVSLIVACHGPTFAFQASILNQISIKIWENSNLTEKRKFLVLMLTLVYRFILTNYFHLAYRFVLTNYYHKRMNQECVNKSKCNINWDLW